MILPKYSLDRDNTVFSMLRTPQSTPHFFVAEHYGLRKTSSWWSISPHLPKLDPN
jgi:hypothetical protein